MTGFLVDTHRIDAGDHDRYLAFLRERTIPVMRRAGLRLVSCLATLPDLGEDVSVQTTWAFDDHVAFNEIRKNLVFDPDGWGCAGEARAIWKGGERRFFYPTGIEGPGEGIS